MAKSAFFTIIFFLLCSCTTSQKDKRKAQLQLNLAVAHLEEGNYPEALKVLLVANEQDPDNPFILNNLGLAYYVRDEYVMAQPYFEKAINLKSGFTDAKNNLGMNLVALGRYNEAIDILKEVLRDLTYNTPEKAHTNLGLAYMKKGLLTEAKNSFSKALQIKRDFCPAFKYYGQTLYLNKEYQKAANLFDRSLKLCEKTPQEVHYFSALSYYKLGQKDQAQARFEEIIKNYPESEFAQKSETMLNIINKE